MTETKKCEFCDKRGLPLLLVRDAVARPGAGAPLANDLTIELPPGAAQYTKRLLRSGYVNVYDEARKYWDAYFVTTDGYFFKLLRTAPGVAPIVPVKPFNCPDLGHRAVASCITVPDPLHATKVWIGFSDVLWTDAVRAANGDEAYRQRHMVALDVVAILAGQSVAHTRPIAQLTAVVAEYAMSPVKAKAGFGWALNKFNERSAQGERLIKECDALRPGKAQVVTVPDPAGIAQELAHLMQHNIELFTAKPEYSRNLAANAAISQIEFAVRKQAQLDELTAADEAADQQAAANPLGQAFSESTRQRNEAVRNVTAPQATRASNEGWKKYAKKFDNHARLKWMESFNTKLAVYDQECIAPLARKHVEWMRSAALAHYFYCNYDRADIDSGLVYTTVLTHCVASTQDKNACAALYNEWLAGDIADTKNLLLQGLIFNMKPIGESVQSAITVSIDPRQIPWDNVLAAYEESVKRLSEGARDATARLIAMVGGPLTRLLGKFADGTVQLRSLAIVTGLIAGHPVVVCEIVGSRKEFRALLIRELTLASGQPLKKSQIEFAVAQELKLQAIQGAPMEGTGKRYWLAMADLKKINGMPSTLNQKQRAEWVASSITTAKKLEELNLGRWRAVVTTEVRFGVIAGLLQAASLTKAIADQEKALGNENQDATLRMYAGMATVAATTGDVIGQLLEKRALQGLRYGQGVAEYASAFLAKWAFRVGVGAGLLMSLLDVYKAAKEVQEDGDGLLIFSYGASAVAGVGLITAIASVAMLGASGIPIIGILILLLIGIGILIEYIKDNPIQDWMERCPWGSLPAQRYPDMKTEQDQLTQALK